jgi:rubrerythrin
VQVTHHVKHIPYPQFRARLLRIIAEEQTHVQWLYDRILMRQYESHSPDREQELIAEAGGIHALPLGITPGV